MTGSGQAAAQVAAAALIVRQYMKQGYYPAGFQGSGMRITDAVTETDKHTDTRQTQAQAHTLTFIGFLSSSVSMRLDM